MPGQETENQDEQEIMTKIIVARSAITKLANPTFIAFTYHDYGRIRRRLQTFMPDEVSYNMEKLASYVKRDEVCEPQKKWWSSDGPDVFSPDVFPKKLKQAVCELYKLINENPCIAMRHFKLLKVSDQFIYDWSHENPAIVDLMVQASNIENNSTIEMINAGQWFESIMNIRSYNQNSHKLNFAKEHFQKLKVHFQLSVVEFLFFGESAFDAKDNQSLLERLINEYQWDSKQKKEACLCGLLFDRLVGSISGLSNKGELATSDFFLYYLSRAEEDKVFTLLEASGIFDLKGQILALIKDDHKCCLTLDFMDRIKNLNLDELLPDEFKEIRACVNRYYSFSGYNVMETLHYFLFNAKDILSDEIKSSILTVITDNYGLSGDNLIDLFACCMESSCEKLFEHLNLPGKTVAVTENISKQFLELYTNNQAFQRNVDNMFEYVLKNRSLRDCSFFKKIMFQLFSDVESFSKVVNLNSQAIIVLDISSSDFLSYFNQCPESSCKYIYCLLDEVMSRKSLDDNIKSFSDLSQHINGIWEDPKVNISDVCLKVKPVTLDKLTKLGLAKIEFFEEFEQNEIDILIETIDKDSYFYGGLTKLLFQIPSFRKQLFQGPTAWERLFKEIVLSSKENLDKCVESKEGCGWIQENDYYDKLTPLQVKVACDTSEAFYKTLEAHPADIDAILKRCKVEDFALFEAYPKLLLVLSPEALLRSYHQYDNLAFQQILSKETINSCWSEIFNKIGASQHGKDFFEKHLNYIKHLDVDIIIGLAESSQKILSYLEKDQNVGIIYGIVCAETEKSIGFLQKNPSLCLKLTNNMIVYLYISCKSFKKLLSEEATLLPIKFLWQSLCGVVNAVPSSLVVRTNQAEFTSNYPGLKFDEREASPHLNVKSESNYNAESNYSMWRLFGDKSSAATVVKTTIYTESDCEEVSRQNVADESNEFFQAQQPHLLTWTGHDSAEPSAPPSEEDEDQFTLLNQLVNDNKELKNGQERLSEENRELRNTVEEVQAQNEEINRKLDFVLGLLQNQCKSGDTPSFGK